MCNQKSRWHHKISLQGECTFIGISELPHEGRRDVEEDKGSFGRGKRNPQRGQGVKWGHGSGESCTSQAAKDTDKAGVFPGPKISVINMVNIEEIPFFHKIFII